MQSAFNASVFDKVVLAVGRAVHAEASGLARSTRLADDLALSRLGRMRLALALEAMFQVELADEVVERFVDLGDIAGYFSDRYFGDVEPSTLAIEA